MPGWKRTLYVLWWLQFLTQMTTTLGLTFVPFFLEQDPYLQVTDPKQRIFYTSLILAAPFFTTLLATPLWGWLSDRTGRKQQVVRAAFGLGLTQLLLGLARSPEQLVVIRMVQGLISGVVAANLALLSSVAPEEKQGWAISTLQSSSPAGVIFGPVFGGLLASALGYRPVYWLFGGILIACGIMVWLLIQDDSPLVTAEKNKSTDVETSAGAASSPTKVTESTNPFRDLGIALLRTWQQPGLRVAFLLLILGQLAWTNTQVIFSIYAEKLIRAWNLKHHMAPTWWNDGLMFAALCMTLTGVLHFVTSPWWGKLHDEKHKNLVPFGSVLSGISVLLLAFWPPLWLVFLARIGMGAGLAPTSNLPFADVSAQVSAKERGKYMGLATASTHVGKMVGLLMGGLLASWAGASTNFALTAGLFLLMAWVGLQQTPAKTNSP